MLQNSIKQNMKQHGALYLKKTSDVVFLLVLNILLVQYLL